MRRRSVICATVLVAIVAATAGISACGSQPTAADWCGFGERIAEQDLLLASADLSDPNDIERTFSTLRTSYRDAERAAPPAIRSDVQLVKSAFDEIYGALEDAEFDLARVDASVFDVFDAEVDAAGTRIEQYGITECGFVDQSTGQFEAPNESLTEAEVDQLLGNDELLETLRDDLVAAFTAEGYPPEQANCLADVFDVEVFLQLETDPTLVDEVRASIIACGVEPAELDGLLGDG